MVDQSKQHSLSEKDQTSDFYTKHTSFPSNSPTTNDTTNIEIH